MYVPVFRVAEQGWQVTAPNAVLVELEGQGEHAFLEVTAETVGEQVGALAKAIWLMSPGDGAPQIPSDMGAFEREPDGGVVLRLSVGDVGTLLFQLTADAQAALKLTADQVLGRWEWDR